MECSSRCLIIFAAVCISARVCLAQADISSIMMAQSLMGQQTGGLAQSMPSLLQSAGSLQAMIAAIESTDADVLARMTLGKDYKKVLDKMKSDRSSSSNDKPNKNLNNLLDPEVGFTDVSNKSLSVNPKTLLENLMKNGGNSSSNVGNLHPDLFKLMMQHQQSQRQASDEGSSKSGERSRQKDNGNKVQSGEQAKSRSASADALSELGSLMDVDDLGTARDDLKQFSRGSAKNEYVDMVEKDGSYELIRKSSSEKGKSADSSASRDSDDKISKSKRSRSKHDSKSKSRDDEKSKKSKKRRKHRKRKSKKRKSKHNRKSKNSSSHKDSNSKSKESNRDRADVLSRTTTPNPLTIFSQPAGGYPNPYPPYPPNQLPNLQRESAHSPRKNLVINLLMTIMEELVKADGAQAKEKTGVSFLYKGKRNSRARGKLQQRRKTAGSRQAAAAAATRPARYRTIQYLDAREGNGITVTTGNAAAASLATPSDDAANDTEPIITTGDNDLATDSNDNTSPGRLVSVSHGWMAPAVNSSQRVTNVTSLRQCVDECMQQAECQSADYSYETGACSMHTNDVIQCSSLLKQATMTHIRKEPCESRSNISSSRGSVILGAQLTNGTDQPNTNDFKTCVETCRSPSSFPSSSPSPSLGNCTAVNYDLVSRQCRHFHHNNLCATPTNTADLFDAKTSVISVLLCH